MDTLAALAFCSILALTGLYLNLRHRKLGLRLPPGPKGFPLIGHGHLISSGDAYEGYQECAKQYGDITYLNVCGHPVVILSSVEAANDLLEKRSALYSDRPNFTAYSILGWGLSVAFLPYGQRFRRHRKLIQTYLSAKACTAFQTIQTQNAHLLISRLMENKGDFDHLILGYTTAIIMRIAYGHQILSDDDQYVRLAEEHMGALRDLGAPGTTLVDFFPRLEYLPRWFPGAHYAHVARTWKWAADALINTPYNLVSRAVMEGVSVPCFVSTQIEAANECRLTQDEEDDVKVLAATMYGAGAGTTWDALNAFILAMVLYPECQEIGQKEVDSVVGRNRLPTYEDRDSLPYIECVVQEVLRWNPPGPLGIPHRATHDDVYHDMMIPKGSTIVTNIKGMSLDEGVYANPERFNPARFLPKSKGGNGEPHFQAVFGFGRRICPGRHLALASIFTVVSNIFSTLQISRAKDENGKEIVPKPEFTTGFSSHPKPFKCNFSVRSEGSRQMVQEGIRNQD